MLAMRASALSGAIRQAAERKARKVAHLGWFKNLIYRHSSVESGTDCFWFNADFIGPFRNGERDPIMRNTLIGASIVLLDFFRGPTAVAWFIVSIIVNSIERAIQWARPHIFVKVPEVVPPLADLDSTASVSVPIMVVSMVASANHCVPQGVLARLSAHIFVLMRHAGFSSLRSCFSFKATTRFDFPMLQMACSDQSGLTALTLTKPIIPGELWVHNYRSKPAENNTSEVFWKRHGESPSVRGFHYAM